MAINDTSQLAVTGNVSGQRHVHTLHFRAVDGLATEQTLIDAWQANCRTAYRAMFVTSQNPVQLLVARQVCGSIPLRATVEETEVAPNIAGSATGASPQHPAYVAAVVSVRTAFSGKSRRGRFFIGGLQQSWTSENAITSAYRTLVLAYCTALSGAFIGANSQGGWQLVVHSHKLAQPGVNCQNSSTPVTGFLVRDQPGTMRSRKQGSGD